jgi:hypothetical protein
MARGVSLRRLRAFVARIGLDEAARRLGRSVPTVRRWLSSGVPASAVELAHTTIARSERAQRAALARAERARKKRKKKAGKKKLRRRKLGKKKGPPRKKGRPKKRRPVELPLEPAPSPAELVSALIERREEQARKLIEQSRIVEQLAQEPRIQQNARDVAEHLAGFLFATEAVEIKLAYDAWYRSKEGFRQTWGKNQWVDWFDWIVDEYAFDDLVVDYDELRDT